MASTEDIRSKIQVEINDMFPSKKLLADDHRMIDDFAIWIAGRFNGSHINVEANMGITEWLKSDDTCESSIYMAFLLAPEYVGDQPFSFPKDHADFHKCMLLTIADPSLLTRFPLIKKNAAWAELVKHWDTWCEAYHKRDFVLINKGIIEIRQHIPDA